VRVDIRVKDHDGRGEEVRGDGGEGGRGRDGEMEQKWRNVEGVGEKREGG